MVNQLYGTEFAISLEGHTGKSLRNFVQMIYSKQHLMMKALEMEEKIVTEELVMGLCKDDAICLTDIKKIIDDTSCCKLEFDFEKNQMTWKLGRREENQEKIESYHQLIMLISEQSKKIKHVSAKVTETDNEKFTFRVWLVRLGMIGDKYKEARRILLKNLTGNSAFRYSYQV